jgi:hypothetical protein
MTMKNISLFALLGVFACVGCVSVDVQESSVCDSKNISFPLPSDLTVLCANTTATGSSAYTLPPQSTTTTFDFSNDLSNVKDVASDLTLKINQLLLDNAGGDLSFVSSVEVDMQGSDTTSFPTFVFATYTAPTTGPGSELNFVVNADTNKITSYLEGGQVQLTITLNSNPMTLSKACNILGNGISSNVYMCVAVQGSFSRKL